MPLSVLPHAALLRRGFPFSPHTEHALGCPAALQTQSGALYGNTAVINIIITCLHPDFFVVSLPAAAMEPG